MPASLVWVPSLVGGVLSGCGFSLVWYRLRRLERLYQRRDEGVPDPPRCTICNRWLFAETLAALDRLDDDDKREHCASCGGYSGPTRDEPPPPPVPVEIAEQSPPPVPIAIAEPAPVIRIGVGHAEHCDCERCLFNRRVATDEAQAQTLKLMDLLSRIRQGIRTTRLTLCDEWDWIDGQISAHIGDGR